MIKSATSTGANYRAASRARSEEEFFSKICIVEEESDESGYWLEVIKEVPLSNNEVELDRLLFESTELTKILSSARTHV